jgi:hypothetical protein
MPNASGSATQGAVGGDSADDVLGGQYGCHFAATLSRGSAMKVRHGEGFRSFPDTRAHGEDSAESSQVSGRTFPRKSYLPNVRNALSTDGGYDCQD